MRRLLVLFGVVFVVLPAGSALASTIGQVGASAPGQCGSGVFADTSYVVPSGGGVINSFSFSGSAASAGDQRDFLVLRASGSGNYEVIGKTGLVTLNGGLQSFPANIAVQSGDILGVYVPGSDTSFHEDCGRTVSSGGGFLSGALSSDPNVATRFSSSTPLQPRPRT